MYDSSDINTAWATFTQMYQKLEDEKVIPDSLSLHPFGTQLPGIGKVLLVATTWVGQDREEGERWTEKIASLGNCVIKLSKPTTLLSYCEENERLVARGSLGRVHTISIARYTPKTAAILAKYTASIPGDGVIISDHILRAPKPNEDSVFGNRAAHHVLEFCSLPADPSLERKADLLARAALRDLLENEPENVVLSRYVSLVDEGDTDMRAVYGPNYDALLALKEKYDPDNVFKYAVPRLLE